MCNATARYGGNVSNTEWPITITDLGHMTEGYFRAMTDFDL